MERLIDTAAAAATMLCATAPAFAATSGTGGSSVTLDVASTLEATFPSAYDWGMLTHGVTGNQSGEQTVNVKSNQTWGVKVASDLVDGGMKEWTGSDYVASSPRILTNALNWRLSRLRGVEQPTSYAALSSNEALITGAQPVTDDSGAGVGLTYKQVVSYADASAGEAHDYRIRVSFSASQGF